VNEKPWWRQWNGAPKSMGGTFVKTPNYGAPLSRGRLLFVRLDLTAMLLVGIAASVVTASWVPVVIVAVAVSATLAVVGKARRRELLGRPQ
jgi:hypothetical protein